ncbi:alpha-tocopherol transfer protein-like [Glandiceps talaboti]
MQCLLEKLFISDKVTDPSAYICTLSPELQRKAKKELNETPETRNAGLKKMYEMLRARPDMFCPTDVIFILGFLRARKFEVDRAFKLLENWCKMRTDMEEVFSDYRPSSIKGILESGVATVLPQRDQEGRKIIVIRVGKWNVKQYSLWDSVKAVMMTFDLLVRDEETQINGTAYIQDMEGFTLRHMAQFGPRVVMKMAPVMNQDTIALRMKSMNVVNESGFFDAMFAIMKPFLKEKIKKRIHVLGEGMKTLRQVISSSTLPTEYGGTAPSIDDIAAKWGESVLLKENEFLQMKDFGIKRTDIGKKRVNASESTISGTIGTYKRLD